MKLCRVAHTCNLSICWAEEAGEEAGGSGAQGRSWIGRECEASLGYVRPGLRNQKERKRLGITGQDSEGLVRAEWNQFGTTLGPVFFHSTRHIIPTSLS